MPAPPRPDPPAHSIRFSINGAISQGRWANVFWARNGLGASPDSSDLNEFADIAYAAYVSHFSPRINGLAIIEGCVLNYYGEGGSQLGGQHTENTNGGLSGTTVPANCSTCISWFLQQRYRGGHARTYLPPPGASELLNATDWTATHTDATRVAADQFNLAINQISLGTIANVHLGTVSFVLDNKWRDPPVFRDFTPGAALVDSRIDSQRRRLGRDR